MISQKSSLHLSSESTPLSYTHFLYLQRLALHSKVGVKVVINNTTSAQNSTQAMGGASPPEEQLLAGAASFARFPRPLSHQAVSLPDSTSHDPPLPPERERERERERPKPALPSRACTTWANAALPRRGFTHAKHRNHQIGLPGKPPHSAYLENHPKASLKTHRYNFSELTACQNSAASLLPISVHTSRVRHIRTFSYKQTSGASQTNW
jgi:hypothetical protein